LSTLKELTAEVHAEAESQPFIKSIFAGNVDKEKYTDYVYQLFHLYGLLEILASKHSIFEGMEGLKRAKLAQRDWSELCEDLTTTIFNIRPSTLKYLQYLDSIKDDPKKLLAHVYVRHMGDMFGGQQLAKLTPGNGHMYMFEDIPSLISAVRSKIDVSLADEAIVAFKHNIEMVKEYND
jgi:heme oxygenase